MIKGQRGLQVGLTYETHLNHKVSNRLDFPYQKNCQKAKKCFKQTYFSLLNNCKKFKDVEQDFRMLNVLCRSVFRKWVLMIWRKEKQIRTIHTVKNDFLSFENLNFRVLLQQPILYINFFTVKLLYVACCVLISMWYLQHLKISHTCGITCVGVVWRNALYYCSLPKHFPLDWPNHR